MPGMQAPAAPPAPPTQQEQMQLAQVSGKPGRLMACVGLSRFMVSQMVGFAGIVWLGNYAAVLLVLPGLMLLKPRVSGR